MKITRLFVFWLLVFAVLPSQASVIVGATRYIYRSTDRDISVRLNNEGKQAALVQAWIDDGNMQASPTLIDVPFVISPPIARMDPSMGQVLRVIFTGDKLDDNKETLFWLNILEIPPKPEVGEQTNYLQFSVRSRLKLFYRPSKLTKPVPDAAKELKVRSSYDQKIQVWIDNPTPYHISMGDVKIHSTNTAQSAVPATTPYEMVAPFSSIAFEFDAGTSDPRAFQTISYFIIDDLGATIQQSLPLHSPQK